MISCYDKGRWNLHGQNMEHSRSPEVWAGMGRSKKMNDVMTSPNYLMSRQLFLLFLTMPLAYGFSADATSFGQ
jgi:hypothetical protein